MTARIPKQSLLLKFAPKEAAHVVTRKTVKALRDRLGFSNDTQVVHYALAALRDSVLPRYKPDDGSVSEAMLRYIRTRVNQDITGGTSLL